MQATTVEVKFEASTGKAVGAINTVSSKMQEASRTIGSSMESATKSVSRLESEFEKTSKSGSSFGDMFKGMTAANLATQAINNFTGAIYEFGKASIEASLQSQQLSRAFEFANGSAAAGKQAMEFVRKEADRLGLSLPTAAQEFAKMSAAAKGTAFEGDITKRVFVGLSEASTVLGLSADQMGGAMNAVQQMMSKGSIQAEELRGQLGERLYGAFQLAARGMGLTTQELSKLMETGKLNPVEFISKLGDELHNTYGESAITAAKQGQAGINRFNNAVNESKVFIGEGLMPTITSLAEAMGGLLHNSVESGKAFRELRQEMHRLADLKGPGAAWASPEIEIQARKNLAVQKEMLSLASAQDKIDALRNGPAKTETDSSKTAQFLDQLSKLQQESIKNRLALTKDGFELERALEDQAYRTNLESLKGQNELISEERNRHSSALMLIKKKETTSLQEEAEKSNKFEQEQEEKRFNKAFTAANKKLDNEEKVRRNNEQHKADEATALTAFQEEINRLTMSSSEIQLAESTSKYAALRTEAEKFYYGIEGLEQELTKINKAESATRTRIEREAFNQKAQIAGQMATNLISAADQLFTHNRKNALLSKSLAISQIGVNTALAISNALAMSGPPWVGIAMAATVGILGAAQAVKASQQKFANGGIVQGDSTYGDKIPVFANAGEMILNASDQKTLFSMIKTGNQGEGGNTVHVTYAPTYSGSPGGNYGGSFTDMARADRVEFGRFIQQELRPKGYVT